MISYNAVYAARTFFRDVSLRHPCRRPRGAEKAGHSQVTIIDGSLICLFFLIAKINQIPETCISQISGILSYFPVFTPSFWKD